MFNNKKGALSNFIGAVVILAMGVVLFPAMKKSISVSLNSTNATLTGSSQTLLNLVPFAYALAIATAALFMVYSGLRSKEIIGDDEDSDAEEEEEEDEDEDDEPKKITCTIVKNKDRKIKSVEELMSKGVMFDNVAPVEPIIIEGKNKFEVKSKYE